MEILDMIVHWILAGLVFVLLLYYAKGTLNGRNTFQDEIISNGDRISKNEKEIDEIKLKLKNLE